MVTTDIAYMAYGNEASLAFMYGDLVLVATFPPYRERVQHLKENFPQVLPKNILEDIEEALEDFPEEDEEEKDSDEDYEDYYYIITDRTVLQWCLS
jgi:hypothetical protein